MKKKIKNVILAIKILIICPLVFSCQVNSMTYEVKQNFKGPCIVFVSDNEGLNNNDVILLDSTGFGKIGVKNKSRGMRFKIQGSNSELNLIDMPFLDSTKNDHFAIYGFLMSNSSPVCNIDKRVDYIEFFVGTKAEYLSWRGRNEGVLEYFDKISVDWCKYYRDTK